MILYMHLHHDVCAQMYATQSSLHISKSICLRYMGPISCTFQSAYLVDHRFHCKKIIIIYSLDEFLNSYINT